MAKEFKSEIINVFESESPKKVAIIKWGDNEPTIDIRRFNNEGMALKGISLSPTEIDEIIPLLKEAQDYYYEKISGIKRVDKRETVDLMARLNSAPHIVENRSKGYVTHDNMVVLKLRPKFQRRLDRMNNR